MNDRASSSAPGAGAREQLRAALARTTARLGAAGVPSPSVDARVLIGRAAQADGPLALVDVLPRDFDATLEALTRRREQREPLQLILGHAPFRRLELEVRPGVFIPRPETELAIDLLREHRVPRLRRVVDLCTGSGALAAAVLDEFPGVEVLAVDVDPAAVDLARANIARVGSGRGIVRQVDLLDPAESIAGLAPAGSVDVVLSNPPYIPAAAIPREREVREHDPHRALYGGGQDGMMVPRAVMNWAASLLIPGGLLIMEHADVQGESTRAAATATGCFAPVLTAPDLTGRDRFLVARRAGGAMDDGSEKMSR